MQIASLIADGKLKLHVSMKVPLEEVGKGMEQVEKGEVQGKVVVNVDT